MPDVNKRLTIVMYHYVRDLKVSAFPRIKGLDVRDFRGQLEYLKRHYTLVDTQAVIEAARNGTDLPPKVCWLTFDDGFSDHYQFVLPLLDEFNATGAFFPPGQPILEGTVLDVHKIHFILASREHAGEVSKELETALVEARNHFGVLCPDSEEIERMVAQAMPPIRRFDPPEVIRIKLLLQTLLPEAVRVWVTDRLFQRMVTEDEKGFSEALYLSLDQLREIRRQGSTVGSHGYHHLWLNHEPESRQAEEIENSLTFLSQIENAPVKDWVMCYPFGGYNETTISLARERGAALGLTTRVGVADLGGDGMTLARLDANDFPRSANGPVNQWYDEG